MRKSMTTYDSTELEGVLDGFEMPIKSSTLPRWQRKALQRQNDSVLNTPPKSSTKKSTKSVKKSSRKRNLSSKTPSRVCAGDRFIPSRSAMDMDVSSFLLKKEHSSENISASVSTDTKTPARTPGGSNSTDEAFRESLAGSLFGRSTKKSCGKKRVLAFKKKAPTSVDGYHDAVKVLYSSSNQNRVRKKVAPPRHIASAPERVLDAPDMLDDYYLNLLDWSQNNILAVALYGAVYLWNSDTGDIEELMSMEDENSYVSSVKWVKEAGSANHLAVATNDGAVQLWDASKCSLVRTMRGHRERVGSLAWNAHILSSGSRDTSIFTHDVRVAKHHTQTMVGHRQEVCGLSWSGDGNTLASGGNDNLLCLWDARRSSQQSQYEIAPRKTLSEHCAAVKALAWCPFQRNVLASGGGTADKSIKFWNTSNGACLNSIDCGSQVCALLWNPNEKELLSSHGFSDNQLCLWKYPSMNKITELKGHTARVLHLAMGPRADIVCSAGADETLRFWNVFGGRSRTVKKKSGMKMSSKKSRRLGRMTLR